MSFCEFTLTPKSSPGNSNKISPSSSIKSIDLALVTQNTIKNANAYTEMTKELSDINEREEHTTDNVWTYMKTVAPANKLD